MTAPTSGEAEAALAELHAGRRTVVAAESRGLPLLLTAYSGLTLVDYVAKDVCIDRRSTRAVTVTCQLLTLSLTVLELDRNPVQPVSLDQHDRGRRQQATFLGALVGWPLAERGLVTGLRRSGIRRPNTLAGILLALTRPAGYLALRRLIPRPGTP